MHESWKVILDSTTPRPHSEAPLSFADAPAEANAATTRGVVAPLVHLGVIRVRGAGAAAFLHAQLSNAIEDMSSTESRLAAYCDAKGRMLALFRVLRDDDGFLLLTEASVLDAVIKRLQMYVLRADVTLEDGRAVMGLIGVSGTGAADLLAEAAGSPPRSAGDVAPAGDLRVLRLSGDTERFLIVAPTTQLAGLWELLIRGLSPVGTAAWRLLDIRAGIPGITSATQERFVPQMVNLEALGGISYGKGCYPGQEVVARMHYLGRLKRRMFRVALDTTVPPAPGSSIRSDQGREAGVIVLAALAPQEGTEALAVLRIEAAEQDDLEVDGSPVRLLDLPYSVSAGTEEPR